MNGAITIHHYVQQKWMKKRTNRFGQERLSLWFYYNVLVRRRQRHNQIWKDDKKSWKSKLLHSHILLLLQSTFYYVLFIVLDDDDEMIQTLSRTFFLIRHPRNERNQVLTQQTTLNYVAWSQVRMSSVVLQSSV